MAYFKYFENVKYNGVDTVNIMNSVLARYKPFKGSSLYYYYTLLDGEKAEDVSYKVYGYSKFTWILFAINNIVDPYHDWMLGSQELESFMESKYGDQLYGVHHFINVDNGGKREDGYNSDKWQARIDADEELPLYIQPISNRDYEITLNDEKRNIKVISDVYIDKIQLEFENLMNVERVQ